jgi:hypothetical protein
MDKQESAAALKSNATSAILVELMLLAKGPALAEQLLTIIGAHNAKQCHQNCLLDQASMVLFVLIRMLKIYSGRPVQESAR